MNDYYIFKDDRYNKILVTFLIVVLIISSSIFGCYLGYIIAKSKENFNFFHFILFLIKFVLIYYISIFVHELGHVGMYMVYKYPIKLVLVGPIVLIVENNRIKVKVMNTKILLAGGLAMIDINKAIKNEEDYNRFLKYVNSILGGGVFCTILLIIIGISIKLLNVNSFLGTILIFINLASLIGCVLPFGNSYGDILLIVQLKKDPNKILLMLSENLRVEYSINHYCLKKIEQYIDNVLASREFNTEVLTILIPIIEHKIVNEEQLSTEVMDFLYWVNSNHNYIASMGKVGLRITSYNLMGKVFQYGIISEEIQVNNMDKYNIRQHPFHKLYLEFEGYHKKQTILMRYYSKSI